MTRHRPRAWLAGFARRVARLSGARAQAGAELTQLEEGR